MKDLRHAKFSEIKSLLAGRRLDVYLALIHSGPATSKELAASMNSTVLSVRPRLCELRQMCHIEETGVRRQGQHEFRALSTVDAEIRHMAEVKITGDN